MENKPKVLILYNKLWHYRIPVWNIISENFDLTVAYSLGDIDNPKICDFKILKLPVRRFLGRFVIQRQNIRKLIRDFDVIIAYGDISWLKYSTLPWFNSKKIIFWTLGVSATYNKHFDSVKKWDKLRSAFYKRADALVFYTDYPINKYSSMGIDKKKMFVANNTVEVLEINENKDKNSLLFIGTLYKQKGIQYLLDSYSDVNSRKPLPILNIIGKGPDSENIRRWIDDNNLSDKIKMLGPIYNVEEKANYFSQSLACISPCQAGLSVLESMGYGVPFITSKDAITGGELFNIHNGKDGVLMDDVSQLNSILEDIADRPQKYIDMGREAKTFYLNNRTTRHMAQGLIDAINYVMNN